MRRYTILLTPDPEQGGYTVTVPVLAGCVTEGDTLEEALLNAREAITLHLDDMADCGEPIPEETVSPELTTIEV